MDNVTLGGQPASDILLHTLTDPPNPWRDRVRETWGNTIATCISRHTHCTKARHKHLADNPSERNATSLKNDWRESRHGVLKAPDAWTALGLGDAGCVIK